MPLFKNTKNIRRLLAVRSALDMSQREMAQDLGVVHGALAQWEAGRSRIPGPVLKLISLYEVELGLNDSSMQENIPISRLSRALQVAKAGRVFGTDAFVGALQNIFFTEKEMNPIRAKAREQIAQQMVKILGQLKGLPQKLGQLYSYLHFSLDPEEKKEYTQLQNQAPCLPPSRIVDVIVEEFGKTPRQLFKEWESQPLASASIGQVHQAILKDGTSVVVKVQYPGIVQALKNDFSNAALLEALVRKVIRGQKPYLVQEIKERFVEECDYLSEAQHQEVFRKRFLKDKRIYIPQIYPTYTTSKVLTMDYASGQTLYEYISQASLKERNQHGEAIVDFYIRSLFEYREFHTDPHPGNFLFTEDHVTILDFGCIKKLKKTDFEEWKILIKALIQENKKSVIQSLMDLGVFSKNKKIDQDYFYNLLREVVEPFWYDGLYEFQREKFAKIWNIFLYQNPNYQETNLPREHFFLNKMLWGVYGLLTDLQVKVNWHRRVRDHF